jgi:hypothetical protein
MENYLEKRTLAFLSKLTCLDTLKRSNYLYSAIIHGNTNTIILKTQATPSFKEDWLMYLILRGMANSWIVTAKILRDEDNACAHHDINFHGYQDIEKYYHRDKKNLLVLSKKFNWDGLKFMSSEYTNKYITNYVGKSTKVNAVANLSDMKEAVEFCLKHFDKPLPILLEAGPVTLMETLNEYPELLDYILITEYYGYLDKGCIGNSFPHDLIKERFKLAKRVKLELDGNNDRYLVFNTYSRI